ncbi:MAG: serine/threonine protein kinase [Thermoleophilaceae bacterium]|nr:serine/threonine protein kinase [Thermoleophilaceae bacterium]
MVDLQTVISAVEAAESALTDIAAPFEVTGQKIVLTAKDPDKGGVVVKVVLRPDDQRAIQEIEILTSHSFSNVPTLFRSGELEIESTSYMYLVEERVEGDTLEKRLGSDKPLSAEEAISLADALLTAIVEMEELEIVHRDIKPANIILRADGGVALLDFGIARVLGRTTKLTETDGDGPHTAGYAPPEVYLNKPELIDSRADLFSTAVVFTEAATGEHPFGHPRHDIREVIEGGGFKAPVFERDNEGQLAALVSAMLSPHVNERPPDAATARGWFDDARPGSAA